jgi:hypothetical protein
MGWRGALSMMVALGVGGASEARAASWSVMAFEAPQRWREDANTFRVLLVQALRERGVRVAQDETAPPCDAPACAAGSGEHAVVGSLRKFGRRVLITAHRIALSDRSLRGTAQIPVGSLDELDLGADRVAEALVRNVPADQTVELGSVTDLEAQPDRRRTGARGFALGLGAVVPLRDGFADLDGGFSLAGSYWYETTHFAIEPSLGVRFSSTTGGDRAFVAVPLDIGGYYIPGTKDVAPFFGGGVGIRYMWEKRRTTQVLGNVVKAESVLETDEGGWGFGLFARAGVMFLRTYDVRLSASVRYDVTFMELNGRENPQALGVDLTVHF